MTAPSIDQHFIYVKLFQNDESFQLYDFQIKLIQTILNANTISFINDWEKKKKQIKF